MRLVRERLLNERSLTRGLGGVPQANLVVWLRGQDVQATPVASWPNPMGTAFTQATAANQPALITNAVNGYPVVRFDGADDFVEAAIAVPQPFTMFAVIRLTGGSGTRHFAGSGGNAVSFGVENGAFMCFAGSTLASSVSADTNWHVYMVVANGASSRLRVNGTTNNGNVGTRTLSTSLRFGAFAAGNNPWPGDIAEVLVMSAAVTSTQEATVFQYLNGKYGL